MAGEYKCMSKAGDASLTGLGWMRHQVINPGDRVIDMRGGRPGVVLASSYTSGGDGLARGEFRIRLDYPDVWETIREITEIIKIPADPEVDKLAATLKVQNERIILMKRLIETLESI